MDFILKFGKHKGQIFSSTPKSYQDWLLSQDWFKVPTQLEVAEKQFSDARKRLGNWTGTSRRGQVAYEAMFEAEKAIDNAIFNSHDEYSSFWDGTYSWER